MKPIKFLFLGAVAAVGLTGCDHSNDPKEEENIPWAPVELQAGEVSVSSKSYSSGFRIFQKLDSMEQGNVLFSPLNAGMCMGMLANGTSGETAQELLNAFEVENLADFNSLNAKVMREFPQLCRQTHFMAANSMWLSGGMGVSAKADYAKQLTDSYQAQINTLNSLSTSDAQRNINAWINEKTQGLFPNWLEQPLPEGTASMLVSTLYFKSVWKEEFFKSCTSKLKFTNSIGEVAQVDAMETDEEFRGYFVDGFTAAMIPYGNSAFNMVLVLPDEGSSIADCLSGMNTDEFRDFLTYTQRNYYRFNVVMPKLDLEGKLALNKALEAMGVTRIWNPKECELSGLNCTTPLSVDRICHGVRLKVDEKGTEMAAVTSGIMLGSAGPQPVNTLILNRPFLLLITERSTGLPLLISRISNL